MRRGEPINRRDFLAELAIVSAGLAAVSAVRGRALLRPASAASVQLPRNLTPVVSIHMDQPYLDWTGRAVPYYAPQGIRSGEPLARLSEEAFRRLPCFV
jgi:hypothetical protein